MPMDRRAGRELTSAQAAANNRTSVLAHGMTEAAWEKGFLMPELPAKQPWERCLYCSSFDLWQGTLAVCCKRRMVLSPKAHYDRRCNSWAPNAYCKQRPDWSAEPAAEILAGTPEFL